MDSGDGGWADMALVPKRTLCLGVEIKRAPFLFFSTQLTNPSQIQEERSSD